CYYVSKKYQDALSFYKKGMEVNREDKDYILLNTGIIYGLLDNNAEAHRQFENITVGMKESRYYDDALFQNAQLYFNEENYQKAIEHFSRIINEKKNSRYVPYSLMRRASANYNTGKYNPAIEDYLFILKNFTKHETASESLLPLQETLAMVNRGAEFEGYLADYKKANPNQKGLENVEYESAKGFYFSQNYDKAINNLGAFISTYPEDPRVPEAIFYVGESYYRLNKLNKARAEYEKLLNEKAFWQYSLVLGRLAEVYYMQKDYRNAVTYYRRFEGMANNKRQQNDSRTGLMQAYFYLNQYDSSEYYARQILAGASVNVNAQNKANLYIGKSLYGKGDYEQAKDEFLNTINTAKDVSGAEAQYLLGEILYQNGEYQHSIEMLIGLNEEFNVFDEWVGKGFLLIVDNYIAMEDYFQARGTLQSLIENFPDEEVKDKSRAKLRKIDELEKKMKEKNNETAPIDSLVINPGDSTKKN
ncbi:MAG: tetratricopeptide repeat protein, partial [Cyclobacteriaceae bacterium]|nr:tetratricopeptide repeat protein [Cyclobacteriaceae bacterium]